MGTVLDVFRNGSHDYVDTPYWSAMQIKVKQYALAHPVQILQQDLSKVLLFVNMTCDKRLEDESDKQLQDLLRLAKKYQPTDGQKSGGLAIYGQFTYDVLGGEDMTNKQIAQWLIKKQLITPEIQPFQIRFLEKVDVNGKEMDNLYKFLKRQSPLFTPAFGKASHIKQHYSKFLCNKYGEVKHYYEPTVEIAIIEADIRKLLDEEFIEETFQKLLNPPDNFI